MSATSQPLPKPRRWWPRFTLRVLLVALTLLCVGLGIWTHRARRQKALVERIQSSGGVVWYAFEMDLYANKAPRYSTAKSPLPAWVIDAIGRDFFHSVVVVTVKDRKHVSQLVSFRSLEELSIFDASVTDDDLRGLERLPKLRELLIHSDDPLHKSQLSRIGDRSLILLSRFPALTDAYLHGTGFTGVGIASLAQSKTLECLSLESCAVTDSCAVNAPGQSLSLAV